MGKLKKVILSLDNFGKITLDPKDIVELILAKVKTSLDFDPDTGKIKKCYYYSGIVNLTINKHANDVKKLDPIEFSHWGSLFDTICHSNNISEIILEYKKKKMVIYVNYYDIERPSNLYQTSELDENGNLVIEIRKRSSEELAEQRKKRRSYIDETLGEFEYSDKKGRGRTK